MRLDEPASESEHHVGEKSHVCSIVRTPVCPTHNPVIVLTRLSIYKLRCEIISLLK